MIQDENQEDELLRSVALQNAKSILRARQRAEDELVHAKESLETRSTDLARAVAMLRATLEASSDGIMVTDSDRRMTGFNQRYLSMWHLPREIVEAPEYRHPIGACTRQVTNPLQYQSRIDEIYETAPPQSFDLVEFTDGRVYERTSRIQIVEENTTGRVWSFHDISERKRSEQALQKQSEWLRVTLSSIGDGVIATDALGRVMFLNRVAEDLTGWSSSEAQGKALSDVFNIVNERTRAAVSNPALRALQEGVAAGLATYTILIARDGRERPIDDSAAPMRDVSGNMMGAVLVFRDISERRAADVERERFLRDILENEERYRLALDVGETGVWDWDLVSGIITWSERIATIYGMAPGTFDGSIEMFARHTHPEDSDRVMAAIKASLEADIPYVIEFRIVQPSGMVRWISTTGRVIRDAAGQSVRMLGATRDVDDLKQIEGELRQAARRKDEFLALLAHELRNPLAPLRNGLQVIRLAAGDANVIAQARAMMDRQLTHLVRLVDDLLDVSRIGQNKMELRRSRVLLKDIIDNATETARPTIEAAGHEFTVSIPQNAIYLDADLTRLSQVLSNLLTNSAKYTENGGQIWLSCEQHGNEVSITVRDNGIGIPADALPYIFDMFSQVDRTLERSTGGLGIGLALVRGFVEMHGGTVTAISAGQGCGSTFTIRLPIAKEASDNPAVTSSDRAPHNASPARRILVVDDNEDGARSLARVLKLQGNDVHTVHDGMQAVTAAAALQPQVILMDVGMPRMNGFEAVRRIRELCANVPPIIIAVTGWGQDADRAQSREAGCDGHLVKPIDLAELEALMTQLSAVKRSS